MVEPGPRYLLARTNPAQGLADAPAQLAPGVAGTAAGGSDSDSSASSSRTGIIISGGGRAGECALDAAAGHRAQRGSSDSATDGDVSAALQALLLSAGAAAGKHSGECSRGAGCSCGAVPVRGGVRSPAAQVQVTKVRSVAYRAIVMSRKQTTDQCIALCAPHRTHSAIDVCTARS